MDTGTCEITEHTALLYEDGELRYCFVGHCTTVNLRSFDDVGMLACEIMAAHETNELVEPGILDDGIDNHTVFSFLDQMDDRVLH
jgi:hypothetical protein